MTEDDARNWCVERFGTAATDRLSRFAAMVTLENDRQNLIAPSTIASIWNRHIVDSAQLIALAPASGSWVDVGTGGGFPGMVVALLRHASITLVEPRRKRAEFLRDAAASLDLRNVTVEQRRIEQVSDTFDVISARAVASVSQLLHAADRCASASTVWLLPRGSLSDDDMAVLRNERLVFHVEHSVTDSTSTILVINGSRS